MLNLVIIRGEEKNEMLVNITEDHSLLIVLPIETEVQLGYAIDVINKTTNKIKEILQPSMTQLNASSQPSST